MDERLGTRVIKPTENMDAVHNERPTQSRVNKVANKKELQRQTQNQENFNITRSGWISRKP